MKKTYLLILLAALTLAGCSKNKLNPADTGPDAWIYNESLPVPIMFGGMEAGVMTKAIVNDVSDMTDKIGVFGLDPDYSSGWNTIQTYPSLPSVLLNNQAAEIGEDGLVQFYNGEEKVKKYYPITGTQTFDFFAYYPRKEAAQGLYCLESSYYQVYYEIGNTDIMWARTVENPTIEAGGYNYPGYNATYMRKLTELNQETNEQKDKLPNFKFKHLLTAIEFKLQSTEEAAVKLDEANAVITGLTINNTYTQAELIVASKNVEKVPGTLVVKDASKGSVRMVDQDGDTTFDIKMSNGDPKDNNRIVEFGNLMLIEHPSDGKFTGKLHVSINGVTEYIDFTLTDPKAEDGNNFEAGAKYTYTIVVKDPQEIIAYAELTDWNEFDGGEIDEMN